MGGPGAVAGPWREVSGPKKISRIFFDINVDCYEEIWESYNEVAVFIVTH